MKLGQKNKKAVKRIEHQVDDEFFDVKFKINGKIFDVAVRELLSFEAENLDEVSDDEFDKALDVCSYWRYTFLSGAVELEKKLGTLEREQKVWMATAIDEARLSIIEQRSKTKKETKVPNSWFGTITKQEIENELFSNPDLKEEALEFDEKISDIRAQIKLMYGLRDVLEQRGNHLQSLGKRRLENYRRNFNV